MPLEHLKVRNPSAEGIEALAGEGWEHKGPLTSDPEVHRFSREIEEGRTGDDITLSPDNILTRIRVKIR